MPNRNEMLAALKAHLLPVLRERGFKGSLPHLRRLRKERIDLMTIQFDKYGGGFVVEIAGCEVTVSIRTPGAILREIASCDPHDAGTSQEKAGRSERARSAIRREVSNGGAGALRFGSLGEIARG